MYITHHQSLKSRPGGRYPKTRATWSLGGNNNDGVHRSRANHMMCAMLYGPDEEIPAPCWDCRLGTEGERKSSNYWVHVLRWGQGSRANHMGNEEEMEGFVG